MPNLLIVLIFALLSLPGFSQEENGGGKVIILDSQSTPEEATTAPVEVVDEEAIIREAELERAKQIEKMKMVEAATKPIAQPVNPLEQIQKLGYDQLNAAALMDKKVVEILQKTMREGAMSNISDLDLKKQIMNKVQGTWMESILGRFPKLLSMFSDLIRDKEALPGLLNILARKEDLKDYGYIWLAIFVVGLYIKHRLIKPKWPFKRRFKWSMVINLVLSTISLGIFLSFFGEEVAPLFSVIGKHLF